MEKLKKNVDILQEEVSDLQVKVHNLEISVRNINLNMENDFSPRLQNIEGCYLTTYNRYQSGVEQIDVIQTDVDMLKKTVSNHSRQLKQLMCCN